MSQTNPHSWWSRATTEDRLSQIDGGIELGMTASQVAQNCGTEAGQIRVFASRHEREFRGGSAPQLRRQAINRTRRAFLAGDAVDLWAVQ